MREHTARLDVHSGLSRGLQEVDAGASPDDPPSLVSEPEPVEAPANIPALPIQLEHFLAKRLPRTGPRTRMFRRAHFPGVKDSDWHDWKWQLRHSFRTTEQLARVLELTDEERTALDRCGSLLPVSGSEIIKPTRASCRMFWVWKASRLRCTQKADRSGAAA